MQKVHIHKINHHFRALTEDVSSAEEILVVLRALAENLKANDATTLQTNSPRSLQVQQANTGKCIALPLWTIPLGFIVMKPTGRLSELEAENTYTLRSQCADSAVELTTQF